MSQSLEFTPLETFSELQVGDILVKKRTINTLFSFYKKARVSEEGRDAEAFVGQTPLVEDIYLVVRGVSTNYDSQDTGFRLVNIFSGELFNRSRTFNAFTAAENWLKFSRMSNYYSNASFAKNFLQTSFTAGLMAVLEEPFEEILASQSESNNSDSDSSYVADKLFDIATSVPETSPPF